MVTVETPCRCGKVTCQKRCQALAPSTFAARSNCSGTVCSPAIIMIMAKGNSRQTLTTISDGSTVSTLSMKLGGRSVSPSPHQHRADDAEIGVVDPLPDIGRGDRADDPGDDQDGAQHAAADEVAVQRQRGAEAPARRRTTVEAIVQISVLTVTRQNTSLLRISGVVVEADEHLVAQLQARRRFEEGQIDRVVDRVGDDDQHHHDAPAST